MFGVGLGYSGGSHVSVPDGLDLFRSVSLGYRVETPEDGVEDANYLVGLEPGGHVGEVCHVHENDAYPGKAVRDIVLSFLEPFGDALGQDVEQELVCPGFGFEGVPVNHPCHAREKTEDDWAEEPVDHELKPFADLRLAGQGKEPWQKGKSKHAGHSVDEGSEHDAFFPFTK